MKHLEHPKAHLSVSASLDGAPPVSVDLERDALPKAPPGYRLIPMNRVASWVVQYLDLPDTSYIEIRWKPPTGQYTRMTRHCGIDGCARTFSSNAALAVHQRRIHHASA